MRKMPYSLRRALKGLMALSLLLQLALVTPGAHASALPAKASTSSVMTFASLGQSTQTVSGIDPAIDLYVVGPGRGVLGPNSTLQVVYSRSPLIDPQASSFEVQVNGVSVAGHLLDGAVNQPTTVPVRLPASSLSRDGVNHIQLTFDLQNRAYRVCQQNDPNLNVTVYGNSWLRYDVRHVVFAAFNGGLADLPAPFTGSGPYAPAALTVGLPASPTQIELTGAANMLARLGEDASRLPRVNTVAAGALSSEAPRGNIFLIGTPVDNPALATLHFGAPVRIAHGQWLDRSGRKLVSGEGLILETVNPWDSQHAILVATGNDQEGVRRAAVVLASATLRRLLHGRYALLPSMPHIPSSPVTTLGTVSLAMLGYRSTTVEGTGERDARFTFDLPQVPAGGASFELNYGHSSAAAPGLSSVRADLNGQPLASRQFSTHDPAYQRWNIAIPAGQLTVGTNVLTVRFFLDTAYSYCKMPAYSSLWGTVDASSALTLPFKGASVTPTLDLLPFPLVTDGSPNNTILVVPSRTAQQHNALALALLIGAQSHVDTPQFSVMRANRVSEGSLKDHTVVLDGLPRTNPLLARVEPYTPVRTPSSLDFSADTSGLTASIHEAGQVGIVEEYASPWSPDHTVVVLSATTPALLPTIRRTAFAGGLSGTVATVDQHDKVQSFDTHLAMPGAPVGPKKRPIMPLAMAGLVALLFITALTITQRYKMERDTP